MNKRAILISNNKPWDNNDLCLRFAESDAEEVAKCLKAEPMGFKRDDEVVYLTGNNTGWDKIVCEFDKVYNLSKRERLDLLIVGFWGYGVGNARDNKRYFCGARNKSDDFENTAWSFLALLGFIREIDSVSTMVFLDCCHKMSTTSSGFSRETFSLFSEDEAKKYNNVISRGDAFTRTIPKIALFQSCCPNQHAYELAKEKRGAFTYFLLQALGRKDKPFRSAYECFDYIYDQMEKENAKKQLPCLIHNFLAYNVGEAYFFPKKDTDIFNDWLWYVYQDSRFMTQEELIKEVNNNRYNTNTSIYSPETGKTTLDDLLKGNTSLDKELLRQWGSIDDEMQSRKTSVSFSALDYYSWGESSTRKTGEESKKTLTLGGVDFRFCWCPPGEFMIGCPKEENGRRENEDLPNIKTIKRGFWMLETPVTQKMWNRIMGDNPSIFSPEGAAKEEVAALKIESTENFPVECVSWKDVQGFLNKLNQFHLGLKFRLPTEVEWEYACRAGKDYTWSGCNDLRQLKKYTWFSGNGEGRPHEVGLKKANAWGLYDMSGNVWEWCASKYETDNSRNEEYYVTRGGSFDFDERYCRCARRNFSESRFRNNNLGFRIVLEAPKKQL